MRSELPLDGRYDNALRDTAEFFGYGRDDEGINKYLHALWNLNDELLQRARRRGVESTKEN